MGGFPQYCVECKKRCGIEINVWEGTCPFFAAQVHWSWETSMGENSPCIYAGFDMNRFDILNHFDMTCMQCQFFFCKFELKVFARLVALIISFRSITTLYGNNIPHNIFHILTGYVWIFYGILFVPRNIVMDLNYVMFVWICFIKFVAWNLFAYSTVYRVYFITTILWLSPSISTLCRWNHTWGGSLAWLATSFSLLVSNTHKYAHLKV